MQKLSIVFSRLFSNLQWKLKTYEKNVSFVFRFQEQWPKGRKVFPLFSFMFTPCFKQRSDKTIEKLRSRWSEAGEWETIEFEKTSFQGFFSNCTKLRLNKHVQLIIYYSFLPFNNDFGLHRQKGLGLEVQLIYGWQNTRRSFTAPVIRWLNDFNGQISNWEL